MPPELLNIASGAGAPPLTLPGPPLDLTCMPSFSICDERCGMSTTCGERESERRRNGVREVEPRRRIDALHDSQCDGDYPLLLPSRRTEGRPTNPRKQEHSEQKAGSFGLPALKSSQRRAKYFSTLPLSDPGRFQFPEKNQPARAPPGEETGEPTRPHRSGSGRPGAGDPSWGAGG